MFKDVQHFSQNELCGPVRQHEQEFKKFGDWLSGVLEEAHANFHHPHLVAVVL